MVEWQFDQKLQEVSRQHENFKNDSNYELMQLLIDVRNDPKATAFTRVNDFLLENTARAYGKNHTIDAINKDIPLRDGLIAHSNEIIPTEIMTAYQADPTKQEIRTLMFQHLGSGLKASTFIFGEESEALMGYLNNSIEYHSEAQGEEKKAVEDIIVGLTSTLVADPAHRAYLSGNFNVFENALSGVERVGLTNKVLRTLKVDSLEDLMDI